MPTPTIDPTTIAVSANKENFGAGSDTRKSPQKTNA